MNDVLGRTMTYLRLSVTERCDFRCRYCMAEAGVPKRGHNELCSFEELRDQADGGEVRDAHRGHLRHRDKGRPGAGR